MLRTLSMPALAFATLDLAAWASPEAGHGHGSAEVGNGASMGMKEGQAGGGMMMYGPTAVASLTLIQRNNVRGMVMVHETDGALVVHVRISGLKPNVEHGFHVHEIGSRASPDGTSAGGHFNPDGKPHGPQNAAQHAGDLPALKGAARGMVDQTIVVTGPTVTDAPASLAGRAVIGHTQVDECTTQPTGNSGPGIGSGVIAAC